MQGTTTALDKGFRYVTGTGGNNNNDENSFYDCNIFNYATAAWSFEHTQSKNHRLFNCNFSGASGQTNQYGVSTALGTQGGSFLWFGGSGAGNAEADFYLGPSDDVIIISGGYFESSGRLLETKVTTSSAWPVTIQGIRWAGDGLNADGKAIIYGNTGPINLIGNLLGQDSTKALQFNLNSGSALILGVAIGNHIFTNLANPFVGGQWAVFCNNFNDPPVTVFPNTLMSGQAAVTIANLPACNAGTVGQQASVSNGQTSPAWNGTVSTTGAVYAPVTCVQTGASTYGWVYR
jgi:hypothetical protein